MAHLDGRFAVGIQRARIRDLLFHFERICAIASVRSGHASAIRHLFGPPNLPDLPALSGRTGYWHQLRRPVPQSPFTPKLGQEHVVKACRTGAGHLTRTLFGGLQGRSVQHRVLVPGGGDAAVDPISVLLPIHSQIPAANGIANADRTLVRRHGAGP